MVDVPDAWWPILLRLGLPHETIVKLLRLADANGTSFQTELFTSGIVGEKRLCREIARELRLPFVERVDGAQLVMRRCERDIALRTHRGIPFALMRENSERLRLVFSPARMELAELHRLVEKRPGLRDRLGVVVPTVLRNAIIGVSSLDVEERVRNAIYVEAPKLSARNVFDGRQGAIAGGLVVSLFVAFWLNAPAAWLGLHIVFSVFFLAHVSLRLAAAVSAKPPRFARLERVPATDLPVYTVLVALYREAEIVPQLISALSRIRWPRSKLEIKLVCEADDAQTLGALSTLRLLPCVEVIKVPPGLPRTKPKALAFALPLSSGEFVTLYDAEDQPHPEQLLEAWLRFRDADAHLGCLQAPLMVVPTQRKLLPILFGFEYAALFRGLLPWLSIRQLILPLGGTSNHFRRSALEEVGGWDPCNVTEDADLGLRLARYGYRCETITRPTVEDAPEALLNWGRQRTRWFKGWIQTWLVHMRTPRQFLGEIGPGQFAVAQIMLGGAVVSALAYVVFVATLVWIVMLHATTGTFGGYHASLLAIDAFNVVVGYTAFLLLGRRVQLPGERASFWKVVLWTPAYWLAMSLAAWRALWELYRRPHHWEKTHHPLRRHPRR
ncbi:MAG: glycosyltransferase family 2 protein [Rhizobiaceae bacterium]